MTIIYSILTIFLFIYGFIVGKYKLFPYNLLKGIDNMIKQIVKQKPKELIMQGYYDTSGKIEVDCKNIARDKNKTMMFYCILKVC